MQAALAVIGCLAGAAAAWQLEDPATLAAAVLLGLVVPFTLIVIFPTNARLLALGGRVFSVPAPAGRRCA